jgi:hypothetical protein
MNDNVTTQSSDGLISELRAYLELCEQALNLATHENLALAGQTIYQPADYIKKRKALLPDLESLEKKLRIRRITWQQTPSAASECCHEIKGLFHRIQAVLMKVLLLDRENQQALLRRGIVPAQFLPTPAQQQPHYVAGLYQRHTTATLKANTTCPPA